MLIKISLLCVVHNTWRGNYGVVVGRRRKANTDSSAGEMIFFFFFFFFVFSRLADDLKHHHGETKHFVKTVGKYLIRTSFVQAE